MNKKGLINGVSLVTSATSLGVASAALATQPKADESILAVPVDAGSLQADKVQEMIQDAAEQTKKEVNQEREREIEEIKDRAEEAFDEANRVAFELKEITEQMNTNIEIYNEGFRSISEQLQENNKILQKLSEQLDNHKEETKVKWVNFETRNKEFEEFKKWKDGRDAKDKDFGTKYEEIKKLYELLKEIKAVSDIETAMKYVQDLTKDYLDATQTMEDKLFMFKEKIMDRLY